MYHTIDDLTPDKYAAFEKFNRLKRKIKEDDMPGFGGGEGGTLDSAQAFAMETEIQQLKLQLATAETRIGELEDEIQALEDEIQALEDDE